MDLGSGDKACEVVCLPNERDAISTTRGNLTGLRTEYPREATTLKRILNDEKRGLCRVTDRWKGRGGFARFIEDVCTCPPDPGGDRRMRYTLDRKDSGNPLYAPDTVRGWRTKADQANNRKNTIMLTDPRTGDTLSLTEWARITRQNPNTMRARRRKGWPDGWVIYGKPEGALDPVQEVPAEEAFANLPYVVWNTTGKVLWEQDYRRYWARVAQQNDGPAAKPSMTRLEFQAWHIEHEFIRDDHREGLRDRILMLTPPRERDLPQPPAQTEVAGDGHPSGVVSMGQVCLELEWQSYRRDMYTYQKRQEASSAPGAAEERQKLEEELANWTRVLEKVKALIQAGRDQERKQRDHDRHRKDFAVRLRDAKRCGISLGGEAELKLFAEARRIDPEILHQVIGHVAREEEEAAKVIKHKHVHVHTGRRMIDLGSEDEEDPDDDGDDGL